MIKLDRVKKSFGEHTIIDDFSLEVPEGQIHILLGASGSGKTTLLRMIGALDNCDKGEVLVNGKPVHCLALRERTTQMAYITQHGGLFPHLSVKENIVLPAKVRSLDMKATKKKLDKLLSMVDLEHNCLDKYPSEISGGQYQRVALMRGLILDPKVVLMDEPLSALDPIVRASLQRQLRNIFKELGKTVVMVTHDLQEASFLGDKITLLNEGRVVQTGSFKDLFHHAKDPFVHEFVRAQIPLEVEL